MLDFFWTRTASVWTAVIYILAGLALALYPDMTANLVIYILSAGLCLCGFLELWKYYLCKKKQKPYTKNLFLGILFVFLACFCLLFSKVILSFLPLTLGVLLLADGVGKLPVLFHARQVKEGIPLPILVSTLLPVVLGLILIANPFGVIRLVIRFFGISLLLDGVSDMAAALHRQIHEED